MSSARKVLEIAMSQVGIKESPYGSNCVKYNTEYYNHRVTGSGYAWCATFVWWVFKHAGCPELYFGGRKSAFCPTIADYYISHKQTVSKSKGRGGDIVLFDWNKDRSSDHIGIIVRKNSNGTYTTIEGNTSTSSNGNGGMVMYRTRRQWEISYICRPKYTESSSTPTVNKPVLVVDGEWGLTTTYYTQKLFGTPIDKIISSQPKSCQKYLINADTLSWKFVRTRSKGSTVIKAIQRELTELGFPIGEIDGKAGKKTIIAIQSFLKKAKLYNGEIDGYMGEKTVKGWQSYLKKALKL